MSSIEFSLKSTPLKSTAQIDLVGEQDLYTIHKGSYFIILIGYSWSIARAAPTVQDVMLDKENAVI